MSDMSSSLRSAFGTSKPTVPCPGMAPVKRTLSEHNPTAISSVKFLILEILTPTFGLISNKVAAGPSVAEIVSIPMWKEDRISRITCFCFSVSMICLFFCSAELRETNHEAPWVNACVSRTATQRLCMRI